MLPALRRTLTRLLVFVPLISGAFTLLPTYNWLLEANISLSLQRLYLHVIGAFWFLYVRREYGQKTQILTFALLLLFSLSVIRDVYPFYFGGAHAGERIESISSFSLLYAEVDSKYQRYDDLLREIKQRNPDVVALVELNPGAQKVLKLRERYTYVAPPDGDTSGLGIYSRLPLGSEISTSVGEDTAPVLFVPVVIAPQRSVLFTLLRAPSPRDAAQFHARKKVLRRVATKLRHTPGDAVIAGNFNATPFTFVYQIFIGENGFDNAMHGFGLHSSWHRGIFGLTLDHVLYRGDLLVRDFVVLPDAGLDHRPYFVRFEVIAPSQKPVKDG